MTYTKTQDSDLTKLYMITKYFEIITSNKQQLISLHKYELDSFQSIVKFIDDYEESKVSMQKVYFTTY